MSKDISLITVLGPTAVGKTTFAAHLAKALDGEIISADSRQVFRGMDIGTGKDLGDYKIDNQIIPSHLIDIAEPGTEYNVFRFQQDFRSAYTSVVSKGKTPVLCGGTGLYLESVLLGYNLIEVPVDTNLRLKLGEFTENELVVMLSRFRQFHNTTDILDRDRLVRAIEIEVHNNRHKKDVPGIDFRNTTVFGIKFERKAIREHITARLQQRINSGMIEEVQRLIDQGISRERMMFYGLEYKYVTLYLSGELSLDEMFSLLNTAIHQFAKRQMTWFRRMEKKGIRITWLRGEEGLSAILIKALNVIKNEQK